MIEDGVHCTMAPGNKPRPKGGPTVTAAIAKVTGKGQVTVPKVVREHLSIGNEDRVAFILDGDRVYVDKVPGRVSASQVFGVLHRPGTPTLDVDEARARVKAERASRYREEPEVR